MATSYLILFFFLIISMLLSVWARKLTLPAALVGGVIGYFIFIGAGATGIAMIVAFFILGTAATSWKMERKQLQTIAERDKGKRRAGQVLANAGVAGLLGMMVLLFPQQKIILQLMMASSFSSATADTLSSELGNVYGRKFYNILTLQKDERGRNGVISAEGTVIGFLGSILIAVVYSIGFGWGFSFLWIIIAGTIGNLSDSILGATLERNNIIKNNAVNFLNTLVAAVAGAVCFYFFS